MNLRAVGRTSAAIAVVVIVIIAAVGIYFVSQPATPSMTSSSTMGQSGSSSPTHDTLVMDAWSWPFPGDLNQLEGACCGPWPNYLQYTVYQPLVMMDAAAEMQNGTFIYQPGLAANWTASPDKTTYTFNLRQDVKFSNGDPFNAYQVWMEEYGFYYLSGNSTCWWENYCLFNMPTNFGPATISLINQTGLINPGQQALNVMMNSAWPIYVTGPYQIVFHLNGPFIWFPGTMVAFAGLMFDTQYVLNHGGFGTPTLFNSNFNLNPIPGSGPYIVTGAAENSYVKFAQDPNYWGLSFSQSDIAAQPFWDPGHAKNVIIYAKTDDVAKYTDLATGAAQVVDIGTADWNLVTSNPQYAWVSIPATSNPAVYFVVLNTKLYPTNVTLVRQAIVHAINYTEISQKAYFGQLTPFVGPEYPAQKDFYNLGNFSPYSYNLTLAKHDLAQANIQNMPTFTMRIINDCTVCETAAELVQSDLNQIGITVNIVVLQTSQFYSPYGNYATNSANAQQLGQISLINGGFSFTPYAMDPANYYSTFVNNASVWNNAAAYSNPVVQKCVNAFTSSPDISYIQSVCTPAQAQIYNDAPYGWLGVDQLFTPSGGSPVWNKNVVRSFLLDPVLGGQDTEPIFNTLTFVS